MNSVRCRQCYFTQTEWSANWSMPFVSLPREDCSSFWSHQPGKIMKALAQLFLYKGHLDQKKKEKRERKEGSGSQCPMFDKTVRICGAVFLTPAKTSSLFWKSYIQTGDKWLQMSLTTACLLSVIPLPRSRRGVSQMVNFRCGPRWKS